MATDDTAENQELIRVTKDAVHQLYEIVNSFRKEHGLDGALDLVANLAMLVFLCEGAGDIERTARLVGETFALISEAVTINMPLAASARAAAAARRAMAEKQESPDAPLCGRD